MLLRRAPGAKPGAPTPEVAGAVAAVKRYFEGKETDFFRFKLDLGEQDPFFQRIYAAARLVGSGHTTTYCALAKELGARPEAARDVGQAMARIRWRRSSPATGSWRQAARLAVFLHQAARRRRPACSR
jgi:methylated-DNA-[protein]-cysteine S-methyltransferase